MPERGLIERLKAEMQRANINARELAQKAGVGQSFVYDILNGKSLNPTVSNLSAIAAVLGVSVAYLAEGKGKKDVFASPSSTTIEKEDFVPVMEISNSFDPNDGLFVKNPEKNYFFHSNWLKNQFGANAENLFVYTMKDDSLAPGIQIGDLLLVDISKKDERNSGIYLFHNGVALLVKHMEFFEKAGKSTVNIKSDNRDYKNYSSALEKITIIGRVIWSSRNIS